MAQLGTGSQGPAAIRRAMEAAVAEHREGRLDAAIAGYREVLRLHPGFPQAHNNLAVALKAAGQLRQAVASYRRALELKPDYPAAHANLATALLELGDHQDGLRHAFDAVRLQPDNHGNLRILAGALTTIRFSQASPWIFQAVEACLQAGGIEHQRLAPAALSLLRLKPAVRTAFELAAAADDRPLLAALTDGTLQPLLDDSLLQTVLTRCLVPDAAFEGLLTALRRCCLHRTTAVADAAPAGLFHDDPGFIAALASQCFITEYAYAQSDEEERLLRKAPPGGPTAHLVVLAMYRPLHELPGCEALGDHPEALRRLVRMQLLEPLAERDIERRLPSLTELADPVSGAVRQQYEANPYPRWLSTGHKAARPFGEIVAGLFPRLKDLPEAGRPLRVLVAGCGTGKHALDVATRYADAEILAIDISRRSLAYAQRKAEEAGLTKLTFAQADILELGDLDRRFELIESVGVLHHLADPLRGWRRLAGLLAEGGFMKVGLYSLRARRSIAAARAFVRQGGFTADPAGLRAARRAILALDPGAPSREVVGELDFYGLSGCRDLLFHVQERAYTPPEIAEALASLSLEFLGFELVDPAVREAYAARFPDDPGQTDLALWDAFEEAAPDTFHNMYQLWCRKI